MEMLKVFTQGIFGMYNIQYRNMSEEEISTLKNLLEKLLANFYC